MYTDPTPTFVGVERSFMIDPWLKKGLFRKKWFELKDLKKKKYNKLVLE